MKILCQLQVLLPKPFVLVILLLYLMPGFMHLICGVKTEMVLLKLLQERLPAIIPYKLQMAMVVRLRLQVY